MTQLLNRRNKLLVGGLVAVLLVVGILILVLRSPENPAANQAKATTGAENAQTNKNQSNDSTKDNPTTSSLSDADKQVAADGNNQPITDACKLLTSDAAKQIVGTDAHAVTPSSTSAQKASNTTITSCAFSGQTGTVQLVIRKPAGQLGVSENSIQFGSGKPVGVIAVSGYGQAAYWNPKNKTLNILGSNNWYIISRSSNSQADVEAVAKLLAPGF